MHKTILIDRTPEAPSEATVAEIATNKPINAGDVAVASALEQMYPGAKQDPVTGVISLPTPVGETIHGRPAWEYRSANYPAMHQQYVAEQALGQGDIVPTPQSPVSNN